jgi:hypothetical protein
MREQTPEFSDDSSDLFLSLLIGFFKGLMAIPKYIVDHLDPMLQIVEGEETIGDHKETAINV